MQLCICAPNKTAPDHIQNFSGTCKYYNPSPSFLTQLYLIPINLCWN